VRCDIYIYIYIYVVRQLMVKLRRNIASHLSLYSTLEGFLFYYRVVGKMSKIIPFRMESRYTTRNQKTKANFRISGLTHVTLAIYRDVD
jgi:hypothetical protein